MVSAAERLRERIKWCYDGNIRSATEAINTYLATVGLQWDSMSKKQKAVMYNVLCHDRSPYQDPHCSGKNPLEKEGVVKEGYSRSRRTHHPRITHR